MKGCGNKTGRVLAVAARQQKCGPLDSIPSRAAGSWGIWVIRARACARRRAAEFLRGESGNIVIFTALFMGIALLGVAALAIDAGWIYHEQRIVQQAADDGALAAAVAESQSGAPVTTAATNAATGNGLDVVASTYNNAAVTSGTPTAGEASLSISDSIAGPNDSNLDYVQVTVTDKTATFFLGAFNSKLATISIAATAEASYKVTTSSSNGPCLLTIGTSGQTLLLNGTSTIEDATGSTCGVTDNSSADGGCGGPAAMLDSGADLNVGYFDLVSSPGTNGGPGSVCNNGITYGSSSSDPVKGSAVTNPYATLTLPTEPATTSTNVGSISAGTTLQPGTYTNDVNIGSCSTACTVYLEPGLYYFSQGFNLNSGVTLECTGCTGGAGVTIYLPSGSNTNINSAATWNLTAPSASYVSANSGTGDDFAGCSSCANMLIWDEASSLDLDSGSNSSFNGAVYMPNGTLTLNSNSDVASYGMIVADSVTVDANTTLSLSCSAMPSGSCPGGTGSGGTTAVAGSVNLGQ